MEQNIVELEVETKQFISEEIAKGGTIEEALEKLQAYSY